MTRVTIDLDRLRATMPAHPTWPTAYDTTDDTEREDCWRRLSQWLETGLCASEGDNGGQHGATTPPEPETGTQRLSWLDVLDHIDEVIRRYRSDRVLYGDFVDDPEVPAPIFDAYEAGCNPRFKDKTLGRPNQLYKGVRIFRADDGPPWPATTQKPPPLECDDWIGQGPPWPPPTPDMHESRTSFRPGPDCISSDCRDCPTDCEYTVARLWAWELAK